MTMNCSNEAVKEKVRLWGHSIRRKSVNHILQVCHVLKLSYTWQADRV